MDGTASPLFVPFFSSAGLFNAQRRTQKTNVVLMSSTKRHHEPKPCRRSFLTSSCMIALAHAVTPPYPVEAAVNIDTERFGDKGKV